VPPNPKPVVEVLCFKPLDPNIPPVVVVAAGCAPNKLVVCCDGVPKVVV
jgi:hypothetical protein